MADAAIKSLAGYVQKELWNMRLDTNNVEMFTFIADFVRQAFLLRPAAAVFFKLDLICEGLVHNTKRWERGMVKRRENDGDDTSGEEVELATLVLPFSRTRRVYTGASRTRDETLQYAHGAGWWKHGGLCMSCQVWVQQ
ncbi:hypothetical protein FRB95_012126 [Tulasnella sp. JGI-2019a]|nr:hypothetical protein FRB95_012126 [Tulasnella sp. JGI-2019a]